MISPVKNWRETKKLHTFLGKKGKLLVWTKIYVAPTGFEYEAPYFSGIVEMENKEKIPVQIVDTGEEKLKEGIEVEFVIRRVGKVSPSDVINYGPKVRAL